MVRAKISSKFRLSKFILFFVGNGFATQEVIRRELVGAHPLAPLFPRIQGHGIDEPIESRTYSFSWKSNSTR